jgi:hypothetical protein
VTILTVFDVLFFGDRRVVLSMLLGVAYLWLNRSPALIWMTPSIGIMLAALLVLGAVRGQPLHVWVDVLSTIELRWFLSPVNLDFGGFPLIATNVLASPDPMISLAPTYLDSVVAVVPAEIYPNRPLAFSGWYIETFHSDIAAIGGGLASNWVVESIVNFGMWGPVIVGLLTALALNRLCSDRAMSPRLSNAASIAAFGFLMRYDFASFLQLFGTITIPAIVLGRVIASPACARRLAQP